MLTHIQTTDGLTVVLNCRPYHLSNSDPSYQRVLDLVQSGAEADEVLDAMTATARRVERALSMALTCEMTYSGGAVLYRGQVLHGYLIDRLIELVQAGKDARPLALFTEKLQLNPSQQTVENLYQFLEYGRIPITREGDFLAYKAIRPDWRDIHSGTLDNSIGQVVRMPRNQVDDRRDVTCSRGLHVCSFEYLPMFSHADGHVVVCQVNPKDVVAIPADYNNTKMRVSEYVVVGEVEGYYAEHRDVLRDKMVWEPRFVVFGRDEDDDEWSELEEHDEASDAIEDARDVCGVDEDIQWLEVKVVDQVTGTVVFRKRVERPKEEVNK